MLQAELELEERGEQLRSSVERASGQDAAEAALVTAVEEIRSARQHLQLAEETARVIRERLEAAGLGAPAEGEEEGQGAAAAATEGGGAAAEEQEEEDVGEEQAAGSAEEPAAPAPSEQAAGVVEPAPAPLGEQAGEVPAELLAAERVPAAAAEPAQPEQAQGGESAAARGAADAAKEQEEGEKAEEQAAEEVAEEEVEDEEDEDEEAEEAMDDPEREELSPVSKEGMQLLLLLSVLLPALPLSLPTRRPPSERTLEAEPAAVLSLPCPAMHPEP